MPPVSVTMQARNLPLPPPAAAGLDDDVAAGVELLELEADDPQAAASRAITEKTAAIRIFALKMFLLCPGAPQVPGGPPARSLAPAGWGREIPPRPPRDARRLVRCMLAGKSQLVSWERCCEIETDYSRPGGAVAKSRPL
jgi:hypothetical protein